MSDHKATQSGFTLVEIVSVMAVSSVLTVLGLPMINQYQSQAAANGAQQVFAEALMQARSYAVSQGKTVNVCPSSDGKVCSDGAWSKGWLIHQGDGSTAEPIAEHNIISAYQIEDANYALQVFDEKWQGVNEIRFDTQGFNLAAQRLAATVCTPGVAAEADAILVERSGRVRTGQTGADQRSTAAVMATAANHTFNQCNQA